MGRRGKARKSGAARRRKARARTDLALATFGREAAVLASADAVVAARWAVVAAVKAEVRACGRIPIAGTVHEVLLTAPLPGGIWRLVGKKATYERVCFARAAAVRCSVCKCNGAAQLVSGTSSIRAPCAPFAPALVDQAVAALILPSNNIELAGGVHLPC